MAVLLSFLLQDTVAEPDDVACISTVSELHGTVRPVESVEPPIKPQKIEKPNPVVIQSEAKLYKKLWNKLRGTLAHLAYLGEKNVGFLRLD